MASRGFAEAVNVKKQLMEGGANSFQNGHFLVATPGWPPQYGYFCAEELKGGLHNKRMSNQSRKAA
jgi:hypothetical protein